MRERFKLGEWIVYRKQKQSTRPGSRARATHPAPRGEDYTYFVDKYWIVVDIGDKLVACTRRGKHHTLDADDPALRRATWWERLLLRGRFPSFESFVSPGG